MKGISLYRRIASVCITLVMMVTMFAVPVGTNAATVPVTVTVSKAGQVVDTMTFNGVTVQAIYIPRNDSNASEMWDDPVYCCAALVTKFYKAVYGCTVYNLWPGSTPLCDDGYFTKVKTPQVGDIYGNSSHWAIVKQINGSEVVLFEQNWTWYDNNGCYAKYNRTVNLNNLESDVSFFRYSGANIIVKPVINTEYATLENIEKTFSWTKGSDDSTSTLNIYKYNSKGTYNTSNLVSSTTDIMGTSTSLTFPMGHYMAQVINYSPSGNSYTSDFTEFRIAGEPLASSVELGADSLTVVAGKSKTVSSKMFPINTNDVLTWTSSDNSVATVSNKGVVTGIKAGVATITSKAVSGVKDTCIVTVKPGAVTNLRTSSYSKNSIALKWDSVSNVTGYRVFKYDKAKKKFVKIADLKANSYKLSGLNKASPYKFKVRAYKKLKSKNYVGKYSPALSAYTRPDKPKNLTADIKSSSTVKLSWTSTKGASSYDVYASADGGNLVKMKTVSGKKHSAKLKKLTSGTAYTFKVKAVKKVSGVRVCSGGSKAAYVTTNPGKVKGVTAVKNSDGSVALSWKPVNGATKYQIFMLSGGYYVRVKTVSKAKATVKNLSTNGKSTFKIRAYKLNSGYKFYGKYSEEVKA